MKCFQFAGPPADPQGPACLEFSPEGPLGGVNGQLGAGVPLQCLLSIPFRRRNGGGEEFSWLYNSSTRYSILRTLAFSAFCISAEKLFLNFDRFEAMAAATRSLWHQTTFPAWRFPFSHVQKCHQKKPKTTNAHDANL